MTETPEPRRSPLRSAHVAAGARLVEFAGWEMPIQYAGVIEEHRAVRAAAGIFDVSHMGELKISGPGALDFLQRMTPNNVARLRPGRAHYSALLNEGGTFLDDLIVYRLSDDAFLAVVNAANAVKDFEWLHSHAADGVRVDDVSDDYALLAIQGPRSAAIVQRLTATPLAALRYYRFAAAEVAGHETILSRTGYTGEDGFEIFVAPAEAGELWDALLETGAADGLRPAGLGARDTLRTEAGMALYGQEIDATTTPLEAGLAWVVKLSKGDFIGRGALLAQKERGLDRTLVGFELLERGIARQGHAVWSGGAAVGRVTSGTWSPTFEKALGMAYVPPRLAEPGTEVEIEVRSRRPRARIVELPFYRRPRPSAGGGAAD